MTLDRAKLAKLLALTTSDNDGEALNAVRLANKLVKNANETWDSVLAQQAVVSVRVFDMTPAKTAAPPWDDDTRLTNAAVINQMFEKVYSVPRDGSDFWNWLDDIRRKWDANGRLTAGQYDGLRRSYARVMRRA